MRFFIYNVTALLPRLLNTAVPDAARVYDALLHQLQYVDRNGLLFRARRLQLGVTERMYADGFLHVHLPRRVQITFNPDEADYFWLPVWDYAACTVGMGKDGLSGAKGRANLNSHMQQVAYGSCGAMKRLYLWLFEQPAWRRSHGADHIFFVTFKDRLTRHGRNAHPAAGVRNASYAIVANSVFATTEDRLLYPEQRLGCTSMVVPYYAERAKWAAEGVAFDKLVAAKTELVAFIGNNRQYSCHLEHATCMAYRTCCRGAGPDSADKLRGAIASAQPAGLP